MQLGMIGLGRMGGNMAQRLLRAGHDVVGTSRTRKTVDEAIALGVPGVYSVEELVARLAPPRAVWVMVPAGEPTDAMIAQLSDLLDEGDTIIDGGNSFYKDSIRRGAQLRQGLHFLDVGTSGGVWGLEEGYSLMIGGEAEVVARLQPLFEALAPAPDRGWAHLGPHGAGHYTKMVHNGIEYGMMQALAEGFAIMEKRREDLGLDLRQVAETWRYGSVVRSWLLDLLAAGLAEDPQLSTVSPWVSDSGEGRWTIAEAIEHDVAAPVITLSLLQRLRSRDQQGYAERLLAMMRNQFGGHLMKMEAGHDPE